MIHYASKCFVPSPVDLWILLQRLYIHRNYYSQMDIFPCQLPVQSWIFSHLLLCYRYSTHCYHWKYGDFDSNSNWWHWNHSGYLYGWFGTRLAVLGCCGFCIDRPSYSSWVLASLRRTYWLAAVRYNLNRKNFLKSRSICMDFDSKWKQWQAITLALVLHISMNQV